MHQKATLAWVPSTWIWMEFVLLYWGYAHVQCFEHCKSPTKWAKTHYLMLSLSFSLCSKRCLNFSFTLNCTPHVCVIDQQMQNREWNFSFDKTAAFFSRATFRLRLSTTIKWFHEHTNKYGCYMQVWPFICFRGCFLFKIQAHVLTTTFDLA